MQERRRGKQALLRPEEVKSKLVNKLVHTQDELGENDVHAVSKFMAKGRACKVCDLKFEHLCSTQHPARATSKDSTDDQVLIRTLQQELAG